MLIFLSAGFKLRIWRNTYIDHRYTGLCKRLHFSSVQTGLSLPKIQCYNCNIFIEKYNTSPEKLVKCLRCYWYIIIDNHYKALIFDRTLNHGFALQHSSRQATTTSLSFFCFTLPPPPPQHHHNYHHHHRRHHYCHHYQVDKFSSMAGSYRSHSRNSVVSVFWKLIQNRKSCSC